MALIYPLFSGSTGNSIYIEENGQGILIDCGRSAKQTEKVLKDGNIDIKKIKYVFVTHEHSDHVKGLRLFCERYHIEIYASQGTIRALEDKNILSDKVAYDFITERGMDIGNMYIKPFNLSHDCAEGFGYVIKFNNGEKVAICTDLGVITQEVVNSISGCETIFIESNHDVGMLENGEYPYYLKRRILSDKGHLSNETCSKILPYLVKNGTNRIVLSHLSQTNNFPKLAFQTAIESLGRNDMKLNTDFTMDVAHEINNNNFKILF